MLNCTFCHKGLMQLLKFNQSASHVKRFPLVVSLFSGLEISALGEFCKRAHCSPWSS